MKLFTVAELIESLSQFPDNSPVMVYCQMSEDGDIAHGVELCTQETFPYCKGDNPFFIYELTGDAVVIK